MKYLNLTTLGHHLSSFGWDQVKGPLAALEFPLPLQGRDMKIQEGGEYSEFCKIFMCVSKTTGGKFQRILYFLSPKVHRAWSLFVCKTESSCWFSDCREEEREWERSVLPWNPSMKSLDRETTSHWTLNKDSLQITPRNGDLGSLESSLQGL